MVRVRYCKGCSGEVDQTENEVRSQLETTERKGLSRSRDKKMTHATKGLLVDESRVLQLLQKVIIITDNILLWLDSEDMIT